MGEEQRGEAAVTLGRALVADLRSVPRLRVLAGGVADPFFAPGQDFVVLARFDGLRVTSSGEEDEDAPRLPVLTVVGYYVPHPLVVY